MTKIKKRMLIGCIILFLLFCIIYLIFFSGFRFHISYSECAHYENYDSVKSDFEVIAEIVRKQGNGYYSVLSGLSKLENDSFERIQLGSHESECLARIKSYCRSSTNNKHWLDGIRVTDNYVMFEYEDFIGCGIIKASAIRMRLEFGTGNGYSNLADNWYAYYR